MMYHRNAASRSRFLTIKKFSLFFIFTLLLTHTSDAQNFSVNAGLGLEYFQIPTLSQYMNYGIGASITPGTFTTAAQFVFDGEYFLSNNWALGIEYGYIIGNSSGSYGQASYSYSLPSVTLTRVIAGDGYYFSYGGAIGYHFASLGQTILAYSNQSQNFSAQGIGVKIDAGFDTKLGENFYARVSADARGEFIGNFKSQTGTQLYTDASNSRPVNGYLSGVGVVFQLVYYF